MIDGDTGKQLGHSDQMIEIMNDKSEQLQRRIAEIKQCMVTLDELCIDLQIEYQEMHKNDSSSVGDIRRNGEFAPCPDTDELRKMKQCENRNKTCGDCKL